MTTEEDFQHALDVRPCDWQTRVVFADWLQDRDDPRAEGYRAMGALGRVPNITPCGSAAYYQDHADPRRASRYDLPADWIAAFPPASADDPIADDGSLPWRCRHTRRAAEDDAARAFAALPADRRDELLAGALAEFA